jgi:hypothetical protein
MADIGWDGITTVRKLEGSQICFCAKIPHFMASKVPSSNVMEPTLASFGGQDQRVRSGLDLSDIPLPPLHILFDGLPFFPFRYQAPKNSSAFPL